MSAHAADSRGSGRGARGSKGQTRSGRAEDGTVLRRRVANLKESVGFWTPWILSRGILRRHQVQRILFHDSFRCLLREQIRVAAYVLSLLGADGVGMWRRKASVAEQRPIEVDGAFGLPEALDGRVLRILEEAGTGQSLRHARRVTDDLAVMLIGSRTSTFLEFDESLARLEAQGMIRLDQEGFASLSERGRDRVNPLGLPVQQTDAGSTPVLSVA